VTLATHNRNNAQRFAELMARLPEVQEAHALTGEMDYILKVVTPDLRGLSDFVNECCCRMKRCRTSRPRSSSTRLKRAARFLSDRRDDGSRRQFTHWSRGRHASGGGRPKKICIRLEPNAAASVPMFGASAKMLAEIRLKRC
jgi:hypothetical protein